jgi:thioredoxin reductase (NADPH)
MKKRFFMYKYTIAAVILLLAEPLSGSFDLKTALTKKNVIPLAIIGSGPAGLAAAMYGKRLGYPTVVFAGPLAGGQLTETTIVENWPGVKAMLGSDIMQTLQGQAEDVGAILLDDTIVKVDFNEWPRVLYTESGQKIHALGVIVATGAAPRKLGIPGELDYWGRGVTSCSVCDCMFFKGKDVVVVGGGDTAIEEATHLSSYARSITILVRTDRMRATSIMQDKLEDYENVKVVYHKQILKVLGDGRSVTGLELFNTETQRKEHFKTDGLMLAIGRNPNTELFKPFLKLNKRGYIELEGRSQATSVPGVYAAGDVEDEEFRQAVIAAGRGSQAAFEAVHWLRTIGLTEPEIKRNALQLFDSVRYKEQREGGV